MPVPDFRNSPKMAKHKFASISLTVRDLERFRRTFSIPQGTLSVNATLLQTVPQNGFHNNPKNGGHFEFSTPFAKNAQNTEIKLLSP